MDTYDEYLLLRSKCGFHPDLAIARHVWEKCEPEAQRNMVEQFRQPAAEAEARELAAVVAQAQAEW